jgi:ABC-type glutathione transport system ATPase component
MKVLDIRSLEKRFPSKKGSEVWALRRVSFSIEKNQTFGLVGGSGSGKTTLALCILRLLEPTSGEIRFLDKDWLRLSGKALRVSRRRMQPIFQDPDSSLNPRFRISQVIEEPLIAHRMGNQESRLKRVKRLARQVGLGEDELRRVPSELSGGQKQRAAIARALATEPVLLIADEPVSSLDATTQNQILKLFAELKAELGLAMLLISHDLAVIAGSCDKVGVIHRGKLVEMATADEIFRRPLHRYTKALLAAAGEAKDMPVDPFGDEVAPLREVSVGHWAAI